MLIINSIVLCVVVTSSYGLELVRAEYGPGQFNKRVPSRNDSVIPESTSSPDILASSFILTGSETYQRPIDTVSDAPITNSVNDASVVTTSSGGSSILSSPDLFFEPLNLGTITTIARPTLVLPTSTPIRGSSKILDSSSSSASNTGVGAPSPPIASSFSFNATSRPWGWNDTSSASLLPSLTVTQTTSIISTTPTITATPSECPEKDSGSVTVTSYSIIYTSTITWSGDPSDYIPPYPPISTPVPCTPKESPTGRFTITFCDSTGKTCSFIHTTTTNNFLNPTTTVTLITTDKNPAVVFPTQTPPGYGGSPSGPNSHESAISGGNLITPGYGIDPTPIESAKSSPTPVNDIDTGNGGENGGENNENSGNGSENENGNGSGGNGNENGGNGGSNSAGSPPITVIVQPGAVIIGDHTFIDNPAQQTSTVIIGGDSFIISPSQVVGAGATITRPPSNVGVGFMPTPTPITTSVGGLGVTYGLSVATIDGTIFTIKPTSTVVVVRGQTITLGPTDIVFPTQTLHVAAGGPGPTQTAVMGGELITAIGSDTIIIEGTTLTYGPDASTTLTTVVDGDTVLVAPMGVIIHHQTLGGIAAAPGVTKYAIAGGATVTQMGLTAVEISGVTFHVGIGASEALTTIIGEHTLTIGPEGVGMETWTLGAPGASTTTLSPGRGGSSGGNNAALTIPAATGSGSVGERKGNGGQNPRPDWGLQRLFSVGVGCLALL
ncbi:uncharacterized protein GGS22DRAFT_66638 [Annulohypoxylon maeteangense]|uniref:uncharacterized protein n=1 Tax=Annulohypoxylon maeteangense TaxID=1927788 RepID=UPI00200774EF|nr:uncharacterized protein GGS22DRAFT_66638 [Annulohypoxylon maeteangense]KAI0889045.1 hypothetical protein GGS22DRAFT_66638 [Annulohypoxylon maeteangense]